MTLTEFLLARIAEDETAARSIKPLGETWDMGGNRLSEGFRHVRLRHHGEDGMPFTEADHLASDHFDRWDPARVLAECEAKRRIVQEWQRSEDENRRAYGVNPAPSIIACALAQPYADHPDFDPAWRIS